MDESIFRPAALEARKQDWIGSINLVTPRMGWWYFVVGLFVISAIAIALPLVSYTQVEKTSGATITTQSLIRIIPTETGIVQKIFVSEGSRLKVGDPIIELSGDQFSATLGATKSSVISQLKFRESKLKSDLVEATLDSERKKKEFESRLTLYVAQSGHVKEEVALETARIQSAKNIYKKWLGVLKTGVVSELQVNQQLDNITQLEVQLSDLKRQLADIEQQSELLSGTLAQLPSELVVKSNNIERQVAELEGQISEDEAQRATILRSPAEGTVANLTAYVGQSVNTQQALANILPIDGDLQAELWLPTSAIGFVKRGDPVVIRYEAYPFEKFGRQKGAVLSVGDVPMPATEASEIAGQTLDSPRYIVKVKLDQSSINVYGEKHQLRPGMRLHADILLRKKSLIEWITDPIASFSNTDQKKIDAAGQSR